MQAGEVEVVTKNFTCTRSDRLGSSSLAINFFSSSGFFSYTLVKIIKTVIFVNLMISSYNHLL